MQHSTKSASGFGFVNRLGLADKAQGGAKEVDLWIKR